MSFADCMWIWTHGAKAGNQPPGTANFRKGFEIPADQSWTRATLLLAADDSLVAYVNGVEVGRSSSWKNPVKLDVASQLKAGHNVIAVTVSNGGTSPTPAGLMGKLLVQRSEGEPIVIPVDVSWLSTTTVNDGWQKNDSDVAGWSESSVIAKHGDVPWGELKVSSERMLPATYLRKAFSVDKPLKRAILFASALGVYELQLNGQPLTNDVLSPGWTDYHRRVHYLGYDVTKQLKSGDNVVGAILGDGWYAGFLAFTGRRHYYGDRTRFIAQLQLEYADGSRQVVSSDGSWRANYGPIRQDDLLMGCVYDARRELPGWSSGRSG